MYYWRVPDGRYKVKTLVMVLFKFALLQALDLLTTLWFLHAGIAEANPMLERVMALGSPVVALGGAKVAALAPAWWAWRSGRHGLLRKVNLVFAACVAWNLAVLGMKAAGK